MTTAIERAREAVREAAALCVESVAGASERGWWMVSDALKAKARAATEKAVHDWDDDPLEVVEQIAHNVYARTADPRFAWEAMRAVAEWQIGEPTVESLRAEAEAAVDRVVTDLEQRRRVSADMLRESVRSGGPPLFERLGHALNDALVYERKEAQRNALTAIEAVARWKRAEMEAGNG